MITGYKYSRRGAVTQRKNSISAPLRHCGKYRKIFEQQNCTQRHEGRKGNTIKTIQTFNIIKIY
jgi:hypothetical protein